MKVIKSESNVTFPDGKRDSLYRQYYDEIEALEIGKTWKAVLEDNRKALKFRAAINHYVIRHNLQVDIRSRKNEVYVKRMG